MSVRQRAKHTIENALAIGGGAAYARRKHAAQILVLAYHNIVPADSTPRGDRSLHLPQIEFAAQLDTLLATHQIIDIKEALTGSVPVSGKPRAVITFDDAYVGAVTAGIQELRRRELPATVFVTPGFLNGKSFWWDLLSDPASGLNPSLREQALTKGRGITDTVLELATEHGIPSQSTQPDARGASTAVLNAAMGYDRLTLGAHTWTHPNLTALSNDELATELSRPLEWLQQFGDRALPMISYPYGLSDERVQHAARAAGYSAGFMIDGGWTTSTPTNPFIVPRLNVPAGVSRNGFILRAAGLLQG